MRKSVVLVVLLALFAVVAPSTIFAQSDVMGFYGKGTVTGEHFNGATMWIAVDGEKATVISQWDLGRTRIYSTILPITDCEPNYKICTDVTVTDSDNSAAAKAGDKFIVKIDPENKKQVIIGKAGFLENVEIIIDITKIYEKTPSKKIASMTANETQES